MTLVSTPLFPSDFPSFALPWREALCGQERWLCRCDKLACLSQCDMYCGVS